MRWASCRGAWAGPLSLLVSIADVLAYALLAAVGDGLGESLDDPHWAAAISLPAMWPTRPSPSSPMPTQYGGYRSWRNDLADAGANTRLQRAIAWSAGPVSLFGMIAMIATLFTIFLP